MFLHYRICVTDFREWAAWKRLCLNRIKEMIYRRKFIATIKNLSSIYNMNNNSLIETETQWEGTGIAFFKILL